MTFVVLIVLQSVVVMASSSAASSSLSQSTLRGVADIDTSNQPMNPLLSWGIGLAQMLNNLLAIVYESTSKSRSVVGNVDVQNPDEVFKTGHGMLERFATSGLEGFADGSPRIPILRWMFLPEALAVLHNGEVCLANFVPDLTPRVPTALGDSCLTFKESGKCPSGANGIGMQKAYNKRLRIFQGKTEPIVILT